MQALSEKELGGDRSGGPVVCFAWCRAWFRKGEFLGPGDCLGPEDPVVFWGRAGLRWDL